MIHACTDCGLTEIFSASSERKRDESRYVPLPMSRLAGSPDSFHATYVRMSTGLDTMSRITSGDCATILGMIARNTSRLRSTSDRL